MLPQDICSPARAAAAKLDVAEVIPAAALLIAAAAWASGPKREHDRYQDVDSSDHEIIGGRRLTPHSAPNDQPLITSQQRLVLIIVASVGAVGMLMIAFLGLVEIAWAGVCGGNTCAKGWHVNLLKAALVLPPIAALLFAYYCSFSRAGIVSRLLMAQALAFSAAGTVWFVAERILIYVEDLARFE
ncbi:hypothetical protein ACQP2T_53545 [Nonomuraea sp. CA-143628]|uniref:hypothetical protein n=1 Tax=Nonomuraea sp. CA-143628 TaxID=3239997 RepID=UPI003D927956